MFGEGFLGRGATFGADLNLLVQISLGLLLLIGMVLARRGFYRAHGACQSAVLISAIVMTLIWMWPSFREVYVPDLVRGIANRTNVAVVAHATVGSGVLLLGVYVVLVAGTALIPRRLCFQNYSAWMRTLLVLWWITIGLGVLTYWFANG